MKAKLLLVALLLCSVLCVLALSRVQENGSGGEAG